MLGNDEVLLTDFAHRYHNVMGHTLSAAKFGFSSLLELLNDLVEVVHLERKHEMGDWTISHISVAKQKSVYSCGFLSHNKPIFCYA